MDLWYRSSLTEFTPSSETWWNKHKLEVISCLVQSCAQLKSLKASLPGNERLKANRRKAVSKEKNDTSKTSFSEKHT